MIGETPSDPQVSAATYVATVQHGPIWGLYIGPRPPPLHRAHDEIAPSSS